MSKLGLIESILAEDFKVEEKVLEEKAAAMKVDFKTHHGCKYLCYKYDDLPSGYKGGLFPFFSNTVPGVRSLSDYIIFSEKESTIYAIVFELKKGKEDTKPQFWAAKIFVQFIIETANRTGKTKLDYKVRFVSVREGLLAKNKTMMREAVYDKRNHFELKHDRFCLNDLIK
jgi:hypothetical protein